MPGATYPDTLWTELTDIKRRLSVMESTPATGLSFMQSCTSTATVTPVTYGTWEYGAAGCTWRNDNTGVTGTGYPSITMRTTQRMLVIMGFRANDLATGATFRSNAVQVSLAVDGAPGFLNRVLYQANAAQSDMPITMAKMLGTADSIAPGTHTFQIGASWANINPAAANLPMMADLFLVVLPTSAA